MYVHKTERNSYCPTEYGVNIFGGKWKPRILCLMNIHGILRYKQLKQLTPGISDTVLAGTMKDLMEAELVERKQYNEVPLRVEYSLTEKGKTLIPVLHSICKWTFESYGKPVQATVATCPVYADAVKKQEAAEYLLSSPEKE